MNPATSSSGSHTRTLWLVGILHAFTHLYHVALMPLYLRIRDDLKLDGLAPATALVTVLMLAYYLPSYPVGVLADRVSRKRLLGWGLFLNALGFVGLSFAPSYGSALICLVVAGIGGSFFHPAATALVVQLCPTTAGRALGLTAIGASVGFFVGPLYSGWRAEHGGWRAPVLELGIAGLVVAGVFALLAEDAPGEVGRARQPEAPQPRLMPSTAAWVAFLLTALFFSLRDFAGASMGSLGSIFLQQAHGRSVSDTGLALSGLFVASAVSNPLFGHFSDRARMRWIFGVLCASAVIMAIVPHVPPGWIFVTYATYGFFFIANYPMVEAALLESVPNAIRGRIFGIFITIGGCVSNLSHWLVGFWVKHLGDESHTPSGYFATYSGLAGMMLVSLLALPCLHFLRKLEMNPPNPSRLVAAGAAAEKPV